MYAIHIQNTLKPFPSNEILVQQSILLDKRPNSNLLNCK